MNVTSTDRIEKRVLLKAPRARVWHALADAQAFGQWFGVDLAGSFSPGATLRGRFTHESHEHLEMQVTVESVEPERRLSWRWHPHRLEPGTDYSAEPTTLVVFELEESADGTLVTVTESGFDQLPAEVRVETFRGNVTGWNEQLQSIERYVSSAA
ncbi:MAG: SRPBCC family protein [Candidatus Dormibacteraceae bacterium]